MVANHNGTLEEIADPDDVEMGVPHGVGGERWTCNPRVSGSIPGAGNLKKLLIWMKIHGLPQKIIKKRSLHSDGQVDRVDVVPQ